MFWISFPLCGICHFPQSRGTLLTHRKNPQKDITRTRVIPYTLIIPAVTSETSSRFNILPRIKLDFPLLTVLSQEPLTSCVKCQRNKASCVKYKDLDVCGWFTGVGSSWMAGDEWWSCSRGCRALSYAAGTREHGSLPCPARCQFGWAPFRMGALLSRIRCRVPRGESTGCGCSTVGVAGNLNQGNAWRQGGRLGGGKKQQQKNK